MSGDPRTSELDLAGRAVDLVRTAGGPGVEAEVMVGRRTLALTRFANSAIHQNVADTTTSVRLRIHRGGRTATASTTLVDGDGLRALVDRVLSTARVAPADPGWPGLAPPAAAPATGTVDGATAAATPADRAAVVRAFVDATDGLAAAGYCRTVAWRGAFANTAGQAVSDATTNAAFDGLAQGYAADATGGRPAGIARLVSRRLADLDGATLGARAAAKARAGVDPVDLPPGRYEVVLEQTAVADVLDMLATFGFNGLALAERRSFVEIGAAQFDPAVNLVDDPTARGTTGPRFDAEGTVRGPLTLVSAGMTRAVAHDRRTGARLGVASNGRAMGLDFGAGPMPYHVRMLPPDGSTGGLADEAVDGPVDGPVGDVPGPVADASVAALVANVDRGLLVTDNWYTRVLDPRTLVVTGLTRNGVWLIERGEVTRPVSNLRFTQSYPRALAPGAVLGVGSHAIGLCDSGGRLSFWAPALHLASWNYTGGAAG